ncbi:unnamed protein product [Strongylus vulgaris]|uniref:Uncharacterized protein n=1 Tax=Strongylus vulgaris TaxID=40348 RepID=A0A3P7LAV5_STRVU|nr:unnamed protein product [Strongylus vulgaris]
MWKIDTHLCVLSAYDRTQRADRFRVAMKNDIDMYENTCIGQKSNETLSFHSDWDLVRTTIAVVEKWNTTPQPIIKKKPRPTLEDAPLRRIRQPVALAKTFYRKRQGSGQTGSTPQEDSAAPIRKLKKMRGDLAKTFSVPTSQSDLIVDAQVDGKGRSLSSLPAEPWRLPPIRNNLIARNFYANTISRPNPPPPAPPPLPPTVQSPKIYDVSQTYALQADRTRVLRHLLICDSMCYGSCYAYALQTDRDALFVNLVDQTT